jgi:hypothetical protein
VHLAPSLEVKTPERAQRPREYSHFAFISHFRARFESESRERAKRLREYSQRVFFCA